MCLGFSSSLLSLGIYCSKFASSFHADLLGSLYFVLFSNLTGIYKNGIFTRDCRYLCAWISCSWLIGSVGHSLTQSFSIWRCTCCVFLGVFFGRDAQQTGSLSHRKAYSPEFSQGKSSCLSHITCLLLGWNMSLRTQGHDPHICKSEKPQNTGPIGNLGWCIDVPSPYDA